MCCCNLIHNLILIETFATIFRNATETRGTLEPGEDHLRFAGRRGQEVVGAGGNGRPGRLARVGDHFAPAPRRKGDHLYY